MLRLGSIVPAWAIDGVLYRKGSLMKYVAAVLGVFLVALLNMGGHCQEQTPDATQADNVQVEQVKTPPYDFKTWTDIAIRDQNVGNVAGAESAYRKALTLAEAAYRKAPTLSAVDWKAVALVQSNLAMLMLPQGKVGEAKSLLTKALQNDPGNRHYIMNMTIVAATPWRSSEQSSISYQHSVTS